MQATGFFVWHARSARNRSRSESVHHGIGWSIQAWPTGEVALELVNSLQVGLLEGGELYDVPAIRKDGTLYVTTEACNVTRLVSDYSVDDRYDEDLENDDEETIRTFIAVGSSSSPDHVVEALLPRALRYEAQAKLAGASVRLAFDAEGKLASVSTS